MRVRDIIASLDMDVVERLFCAYEGTKAESEELRMSMMKELAETMRYIDIVRLEGEVSEGHYNRLMLHRNELMMTLWPEKFDSVS